jgi:hypothetical protein
MTNPTNDQAMCREFDDQSNDAPVWAAMEKKTVYAVYSNRDLSEGRGAEYIKCVCEIYDTALRLGKRGYVQGTDCPITKLELFKYHGTWYRPAETPVPPTPEDLGAQKARLEQISKKERKAAAIEKAKAFGLTDEEIEALTSKD